MKGKKKWVATGLVGLVVVSAVAGGSNSKSSTAATSTPTPTVTTVAAAPAPKPKQSWQQATDHAKTTVQSDEYVGGQEVPKAKPAAKLAPKPAAPKPAPAPVMTESQKNAIDSANSYLETQSFSKQGLTNQLSSSAGEGYPMADAVFAVNHVKVDWTSRPSSRLASTSATSRSRGRA